jgi:hypothetical protein
MEKISNYSDLRCGGFWNRSRPVFGGGDNRSFLSPVSFNENTFLDEFQIHQPQPAPPPAPAAAAAEGSTPLRMFNQRKAPSVTSLFLPPPPYNKHVLECFCYCNNRQSWKS